MLRSDRIGKRARKINYNLFKVAGNTRFKGYNWILISNLSIKNMSIGIYWQVANEYVIKCFKNLDEVEAYLKNFGV